MNFQTHRGAVRAADADTKPTGAVGLHFKFDVARIFLESPSKDEITLSVQYLLTKQIETQVMQMSCK